MDLQFDQVRLSEDNDLDGFRRFSRRVLDSSDLGNDPDLKTNNQEG